MTSSEQQPVPWDTRAGEEEDADASVERWQQVYEPYIRSQAEDLRNRGIRPTIEALAENETLSPDRISGVLHARLAMEDITNAWDYITNTLQLDLGNRFWDKVSEYKIVASQWPPRGQPTLPIYSVLSKEVNSGGELPRINVSGIDHLKPEMRWPVTQVPGFSGLPFSYKALVDGVLGSLQTNERTHLIDSLRTVGDPRLNRPEIDISIRFATYGYYAAVIFFDHAGSKVAMLLALDGSDRSEVVQQEYGLMHDVVNPVLPNQSAQVLKMGKLTIGGNQLSCYTSVAFSNFDEVNIGYGLPAHEGRKIPLLGWMAPEEDIQVILNGLPVRSGSRLLTTADSASILTADLRLIYRIYFQKQVMLAYDINRGDFINQRAWNVAALIAARRDLLQPGKYTASKIEPFYETGLSISEMERQAIRKYQGGVQVLSVLDAFAHMPETFSPPQHVVMYPLLQYIPGDSAISDRNTLVALPPEVIFAALEAELQTMGVNHQSRADFWYGGDKSPLASLYALQQFLRQKTTQQAFDALNKNQHRESLLRRTMHMIHLIQYPSSSSY